MVPHCKSQSVPGRRYHGLLSSPPRRVSSWSTATDMRIGDCETAPQCLAAVQALQKIQNSAGPCFSFLAPIPCNRLHIPLYSGSPPSGDHGTNRAICRHAGSWRRRLPGTKEVPIASHRRARGTPATKPVLPTAACRTRRAANCVARSRYDSPHPSRHAN